MKHCGMNTGKGRNHDYDPAEERRQTKKGKLPKPRRAKLKTTKLRGQCPVCGMEGLK